MTPAPVAATCSVAITLWYPKPLNRSTASTRASRPEGYNQMRLKLVLMSSLIAAVAGAGAATGIILSVFSSLKPITRPGVVVVSTYLLPVIAILLASIFVYRHTARRRKLQAILTATLSILLTILIFIVASIVTARRVPIQPEAPSGITHANAGSADILSAMSA
jgi:hypothetical protein